jgi:UDP-glucose 6-dehydrogenase
VGGADRRLQQVDDINMYQRVRVVELALRAVRDSPALTVAAALHLRGAQVARYEPAAGETGRRTFPALGFVDSLEAAVAGADMLPGARPAGPFGDSAVPRCRPTRDRSPG